MRGRLGGEGVNGTVKMLSVAKTDVIFYSNRSVTELMGMNVDASVVFIPVDVFQGVAGYGNGR